MDIVRGSKRLSSGSNQNISISFLGLLQQGALDYSDIKRCVQMVEADAGDQGGIWKYYPIVQEWVRKVKGNPELNLAKEVKVS